MSFGPETDPVATIVTTYETAKASGAPVPEAMVLATIGLDGRPRARVVLFRGFSGATFYFFTNYESQKGRELESTPFAELNFHFAAQEFQARVSGRVRRLSDAISDEYFRSRPRLNQISAWASDQSRVLSSPQELEAKVEAEEKRFLGREVPRPPHWGGFGVEAERIELWSGQAGRLHDRAAYERAPQGGWTFTLLYP